ncbi:RNAse P, Rpr2/Rpp21 subunit [Plasmopara halstedii]|uniref:RNAse P, Rpr2/Rpp21 subunit n=1 Tax=Plasmopara halstedii TaxID=4781 RepID=A0A0P1A4R3_PLAHL|nr:RNAse P, Rpr2/Rpp21 subunit [Plasmopara halstedii]CEG35486.1 RNAse P, Rpr2/Rpp21 subunit [Plasmopara halstedii]|eukprot:XP_024571855.1 RNAse P, Rpr2/Rpp21 subunit [Plasmopara halstedii]
MSTPSTMIPAALLLPDVKVVTFKNTRQLEKRFSFLWSTAHKLLPTSPVLANHMIASMMQLARCNHAQLPQTVLDYICEKCGGLLVPSVSAGVRVIPQSRQSPANRRLSRQQRRVQLQNRSNGLRLNIHFRSMYSQTDCDITDLQRIKCQRCQHVIDRPGSSKVHKSKRRKRMREEQEAVTVSAAKSKKLKTTDTDQFAEMESSTASTSRIMLPSSPPRKLLDVSKRKKKKKKTQPDVAVAAVKSSLNSFLLRLNTRK